MFNPKTIAQLQQRVRLKRLVELCEVFDPVLGVGFPQRARHLTPDNVFVSRNQSAVSVDEKLEVTVDYERLVVSAGNRALPEVRVTANAETQQLTFTQASEEFFRHAADDDCLYAAVLNKAAVRLKLFPLGMRKDTQPVTVSLPEEWDVADLVVYVFMLSKDRKQVSDSRCIAVD